NVKLDNLGTNIADSYTVSLYRDGEKVAESKGSALQPGLNTTVSFRQTIKVIEDETAEYSAEASLDGDSNPSNNKSDSPAVVIAEFPTYPTPAGLIASHADSRVLLSWDAPVIDTTAPDAVTETFESAEPFATTVAGWTFLDLDEKAIGGLSGIKFPGIATYSKQSFFVLDNSDAQFNATFETRSGNKCIVAMFDSYFGEINDWAISPELCGKAQTISVYARSYDSRYKESIELLYSTGSLDPADFISAGKHEQISDEWTEYTAELPEGARYFAIRSCAIGASMLMVDDVTYIPASANTRLEHIGYNVYRNGEKLNDTPVTDTTVTATLAQPGFHTYAVTALYNVGESRPAKADINVMSGIDGITADDNAPAEYFNLQGIRVDSPRTGNIYIRRQGSKAAKVIF
ncbi:MAG: choice-of-anchor J domain-containing protein, partial [Muribaculaceae bacterium]|nr:choice-of-anchor J domain-containing protein [Muribaculaceae bacterium]